MASSAHIQRHIHVSPYLSPSLPLPLFLSPSLPLPAPSLAAWRSRPPAATPTTPNSISASWTTCCLSPAGAPFAPPGGTGRPISRLTIPPLLCPTVTASRCACGPPGGVDRLPPSAHIQAHQPPPMPRQVRHWPAWKCSSTPAPPHIQTYQPPSTRRPAPMPLSACPPRRQRRRATTPLPSTSTLTSSQAPPVTRTPPPGPLPHPPPPGVWAPASPPARTCPATPSSRRRRPC